MKYTINYDKIKLRTEANGTYSFLNTETMKIVFLNKVASFIYLHNEINTLEKLVDAVINNFNAPSLEKVKLDCINTLNIMSALELLTIEEDKNIMIKEGCYVAGEGDYRKISNFILDNFKHKQNVLLFIGDNLDYYSHYSIRARQFNNQEYNFIYYNDKKEIVAHITLGVITSNTFALLNVFANKKNLDKVKDLINFAFSITPTLNKIRIAIKSDNSNDIIKQHAKFLGFELEATLKDEVAKNIDLLNYSIFRR